MSTQATQAMGITINGENCNLTIITRLTAKEMSCSICCPLSFIGDSGFFLFSRQSSPKRKKSKSPINDKGQQMEQRYVYSFDVNLMVKL